MMLETAPSQKPVGTLAYMFFFISLLFLCGAYSLYFNPIEITRGPESTTDIRRYLLLLIMLISVLLIAGRSGSLLTLIIRSKYHFLFVCLCFLSALWSVDRYMTITWSISLFCLYVFALAITLRLSGDAILDLYLKVGATLILLSIATVVLLPEMGIHQQSDAVQYVHAGSWRGVFDHRTKLGQFSALYVAILFFCGAPTFRIASRILIGLGALTCIIMSNSGGALISLVVCLIAGFVARSFYQRDNRFLFTLTILFATTIVLFFGISLFYATLDVLGKSTDLTGRAPLWQMILNILGPDNWLGYGYVAGFFQWVRPNLGYELATLPNSQNAYLDLFVYFGYLGVGLLVLFSVCEFLRMYKILNKKENLNILISTFTIYIFTIQISFVESFILEYLSFLITVFFTFSISNSYKSKKFAKKQIHLKIHDSIRMEPIMYSQMDI
ncbi:hypothetical protein ADU59_06865 [Pararhizobium polonicum]|uniref:O-antigen ligase-related domain-containing protein n=1 Tax=Pararhizobium polonicum TaxID=1612624 RepID=A0A1C7P517_9HYPH|nr:O-antigen ligase family protein [Pararhizobium polonicum]OBZ96086.1 hypothetical protein ADU59_06865 [Pararhizobium polonicum]